MQSKLERKWGGSSVAASGWRAKVGLVYFGMVLAGCWHGIWPAHQDASGRDGGDAPTEKPDAACPVDAQDGPPKDAEAPSDGAPDTVPDGAAMLVIVSPPDGSTLKSTTQTFTWAGAATNVRLVVGTTSGGAEIHRSPTLAGVDSYTVDHLPLTGITLFVQLVDADDGSAVSPANTYLSPVRKGLAVVTDFADRQLEDWQGPGMKTLDDVSAQLREMEAHWDWLSRGLEKARWDTTRVRLAQALSDTAFSSWSDFRDQVVILTKQVVDVADYDVNSDGIIDGLWIIAANNGAAPPWLIGGTSRNQGANVFVDGQDSTSVQVKATGNFNHEFGHCLGLPDLYGTYSDIGDLSVMSSSWNLPPNDFCAFDRIRLGWLVPRIVDRTTAGIALPSADNTMAAVKVPTVRQEEYFLIEYRKRPASGFGSTSIDFDGLAVYHVLETSNQGTDPPLLKLEPADGTIASNLTLEISDFAAPGSPGLLHPWVLRSYYGGAPVLQIENLAWTTDGAIAFDVVMLPPGVTPNLITNSSFEAGTDGWVTNGYQPDLAIFSWASVGANGSQHSVSVSAPTSNDVEWYTHVTGLEVGRVYEMCGFIRGQDVTGGAGATISISASFLQTPGLFDTFDWQQRCLLITATDTSANVACRLGGFSATSSGTMWCDDVSLIELEHAF